MEDDGICYGHYLLLPYFKVIWYIFPRFGMLYQKKSGNPGGCARIKKCFPSRRVTSHARVPTRILKSWVRIVRGPRLGGGATWVP
jgi:hypothetical protein